MLEPPEVPVLTRTSVSAPETLRCGANAVVKTSPRAAVERPTSSICRSSGRRIVNGCGPVRMALGTLLERIRFPFDVGPETTAPRAATALGRTSCPWSSLIVNVTAIFSPGSIVPSPSFVPASERERISKFRPELTNGSWSGWRWP